MGRVAFRAKSNYVMSGVWVVVFFWFFLVFFLRARPERTCYHCHCYCDAIAIEMVQLAGISDNLQHAEKMTGGRLVEVGGWVSE